MLPEEYHYILSRVDKSQRYLDEVNKSTEKLRNGMDNT